MQRRLNSCPQSVLIARIERKEPERLLSPGDGSQHFRRAKHQPRMGQEHQLDAATQIQRLRQAEQAAGQRKGLHFAWSAATVLQSKDSRSDVPGSYACGTPIVPLGKVSHVSSRVCYLLTSRREITKERARTHPTCSLLTQPSSRRRSQGYGSQNSGLRAAPF